MTLTLFGSPTNHGFFEWIMREIKKLWEAFVSDWRYYTKD